MIGLLSVCAFFSIYTLGQNTESFPVGEVIPSVKAKSNPKHSYALYLPSKVSENKRLPVIFAFDPGAYGADPVQIFQKAAEKYGFIVAGSNNSQNGMQPAEMQDIVSTFLKDVSSRFPVDKNRVYLAGFSGGARVAIRVAISCKTCVVGVIGSGSGFPVDIRPAEGMNFAIYSTLGNEDYNYPELIQLNDTLAETKQTHFLSVFDGPHSWLSSEMAVEAIEWMRVYSMRRGIEPRDDTFIKAVYARLLEKAKAAEKSGDIVETSRRYTDLAENFEWAMNSDEAAKKSAALKESKEYKQARKEIDDQITTQLETTKRFVRLGEKYFENNDSKLAILSEIRTLAAELRERANAKTDSPDRKLAIRSIRHVFAELMQSSQYIYIPQKKYDVAALNLELLSEITPKSPWVFYTLARVYALNKENKKSLEALGRAAENGMKYFEGLEKDAAFAELHSTPEFADIIKKIKGS